MNVTDPLVLKALKKIVKTFCPPGRVLHFRRIPHLFKPWETLAGMYFDVPTGQEIDLGNMLVNIEKYPDIDLKIRYDGGDLWDCKTANYVRVLQKWRRQKKGRS